MKRILMTSAAILGLGSAATAGSLEDPKVEMPATPVAVVPVEQGGDWTGPYGGLSFGNLSAEGGGADDSGGIYGVHAGYDYDFGKFVLGGEIEHQVTNDYDLGGIDVDNVTRLKLRGGYDTGPALIYATLGGARADTGVGDTDGRFAGLGMDYKVTETITLGAEYLVHEFDDVGGTGIDVDADTISLRAGFRF